MSRGYGSMQQQILRHLAVEVETSVNVVQWQVAGQTSHLSHAVANSFGRALQALAKDGAIRIVERRLKSYSEVIRLFPYKSRRLDVLQLRQRLLPLLGNFRLERGSYGLANNERHVLEIANELRRRGEKRWLQITNEWALLESELYDLLGKKAAPRRLIVDVITRGHCLFHEYSQISNRAPLGPLLKKLTGAYRNTSKPPVLQKLRLYYGRYVPSDKRANARLLSKVLGIANVARHGADTIRTEAAKFLLDKDPTYIRGLPGHRDAPEGPFIRRGPPPWDTKFSLLLDKILTKEVLQEFRFVIADRAHAMAPPSHAVDAPPAQRPSPRPGGSDQPAGR